jgi:hypothetical protein
VLWVQQQHIKRRVKRDFLDQFPTYNPPTNFDSLFSSAAQPRAAVPYQRQAFRGARPFFSDPLFKEQWYMVSDAFLLLCCPGMSQNCFCYDLKKVLLESHLNLYCKPNSSLLLKHAEI